MSLQTYMHAHPFLHSIFILYPAYQILLSQSTQPSRRSISGQSFLSFFFFRLSRIGRHVRQGKRATLGWWLWCVLVLLMRLLQGLSFLGRRRRYRRSRSMGMRRMRGRSMMMVMHHGGGHGRRWRWWRHDTRHATIHATCHQRIRNGNGRSRRGRNELSCRLMRLRSRMVVGGFFSSDARWRWWSRITVLTKIGTTGRSRNLLLLMLGHASRGFRALSIRFLKSLGVVFGIVGN